MSNNNAPPSKVTAATVDLLKVGDRICYRQGTVFLRIAQIEVDAALHIKRVYLQGHAASGTWKERWVPRRLLLSQYYREVPFDTTEAEVARLKQLVKEKEILIDACVRTLREYKRVIKHLTNNIALDEGLALLERTKLTGGLLPPGEIVEAREKEKLRRTMKGNKK